MFSCYHLAQFSKTLPRVIDSIARSLLLTHSKRLTRMICTLLRVCFFKGAHLENKTYSSRKLTRVFNRNVICLSVIMAKLVYIYLKWLVQHWPSVCSNWIVDSVGLSKIRFFVMVVVSACPNSWFYYRIRSTWLICLYQIGRNNRHSIRFIVVRCQRYWVVCK